MKLIFKGKNNLTSDIWKFDFEKPNGFSYVAGQYVQLIIEDSEADKRGTKRWFTLSSSPSENDLSITTRLVEEHSTFKGDLAKLRAGEEIEAGEPEGEFVLPKTGKLLWIAGGIGVTPFHSQAKYLLDKEETRDIILVHGNRSPKDIAYRELFELAAERINGFVYAPIVENFSSTTWTGKTGKIDEAALLECAPDLTDRIAFVSGPEPMVEAFKPRLVKMGVAAENIHQDWFPGYEDDFSGPQSAN